MLDIALPIRELWAGRRLSSGVPFVCRRWPIALRLLAGVGCGTAKTRIQLLYIFLGCREEGFALLIWVMLLSWHRRWKHTRSFQCLGCGNGQDQIQWESMHSEGLSAITTEKAHILIMSFVETQTTRRRTLR